MHPQTLLLIDGNIISLSKKMKPMKLSIITTKRLYERGIYKRKGLMGKKGNVSSCSSCLKEVREELWALEKNKKMKE
ncbi:hypothetical protein CR513_54962, partial [Mucuna pruriens]